MSLCSSGLQELMRLLNPAGIAQALDERGAHQEILRQKGILTSALHLLAIFLPRLRIAPLHVLLVCDGRGLDVLHRHMAQIAVERALILLTVEDAQQIGGARLTTSWRETHNSFKLSTV